MKKTLFTLSIIAVFGLSSCNNCLTCSGCDEGVTFISSDGSESTEVEVCGNDAASNDDFDAAISEYESYGCTCTEI